MSLTASPGRQDAKRSLSSSGGEEPTEEAALLDLAECAAEPSSSIERILHVAREQLDMDVAFVGEFTDGKEVVRSVEGSTDALGLDRGDDLPLEGTYCQRVADGRLPNIVRDAQNDERVEGLTFTEQANIGSYVRVPLQLSDGHLYGVVCCLSRAADPSLSERDVRFMHVLGRLIADQLEREELERENRRLEARAVGRDALLAALQARDGYTGEHSESVVELSCAVADNLGLSDDLAVETEQVALLHDIGKVGIPDSLLHKQGPLTDHEWDIMREHPAIGSRIVASVDSLAHIAPAIRAEHERWDGRGYPDGLSGSEIPLASSIVFACDAYHAMTSDRPYRKALAEEEAVIELRKNAGSQFSPSAVDALVEVVRR